MPSHITHLLLAEQTCDKTNLEFGSQVSRGYLALGSQGPDMFYHNQRRKPSGLTYGSLMHRHGYGEAVSRMAMWAWSQALPLESWAGAWVIGFSSHAILDRHTHPYINYFSGWVEPGDPHTEQFRSMHPFLERLVDVAMLKSYRAIHPNELDFFGVVNIAETPPLEWIDMMEAALAGTYVVAAGDREIRERLTSAYLDTLGFYRFTNLVDEDYLRQGFGREKRGEIGTRWLSIVHPLELPDSVDVLNASRTPWTHPCDESEQHSDSFQDLFDEALRESVHAAQEIVEVWKDEDSETEARRLRIENVVGNWNLSDGRKTTRPCRKIHAEPLPLRQVQEQIRETVQNEPRGPE